MSNPLAVNGTQSEAEASSAVKPLTSQTIADFLCSAGEYLKTPLFVKEGICALEGEYLPLEAVIARLMIPTDKPIILPKIQASNSFWFTPLGHQLKESMERLVPVAFRPEVKHYFILAQARNAEPQFWLDDTTMYRLIDGEVTMRKYRTTIVQQAMARNAVVPDISTLQQQILPFGVGDILIVPADTILCPSYEECTLIHAMELSRELWELFDIDLALED